MGWNPKIENTDQNFTVYTPHDFGNYTFRRRKNCVYTPQQGKNMIFFMCMDLREWENSVPKYIIDDRFVIRWQISFNLVEMVQVFYK
jgi:hypothetical protein